jgi:hypothetical protein
MYRGLKETLVPMARESVLAHLLKLEGEGRVRRGAASAPLAVADRSAPAGDAARAEHASERGEQAWHIIDP